jgi:hypothetical protein
VPDEDDRRAWHDLDGELSEAIYNLFGELFVPWEEHAEGCAFCADCPEALKVGGRCRFHLEAPS